MYLETARCPLGRGPGVQEPIPHLSLLWSCTVRTIDHRHSAARGASSDTATSMISNCCVQAWLTPWGIQAAFDQVNSLPPLSFVSQDFTAGATVPAERLRCRGTRQLVPPRSRGTWCRASTLVNVGFLSRLIKLFLRQSKGGPAPRGGNRGVQSGHKRNS